jgi:hypothetical protein
VVDSEALKFHDDDASGVEYKRGLEAISYDRDAHCIKYKRGLEAMSWHVVVSNTSNGGRWRRQQAEIVMLFVTLNNRKKSNAKSNSWFEERPAGDTKLE